MPTTNVPIVLERGDNGWWIATVPSVPGAFSQGRTQAEARENALDARAELLAAREELRRRRRQT